MERSASRTQEKWFSIVRVHNKLNIELRNLQMKLFYLLFLRSLRIDEKKSTISDMNYFPQTID